MGEREGTGHTVAPVASPVSPVGWVKQFEGAAGIKAMLSTQPSQLGKLGHGIVGQALELCLSWERIPLMEKFKGTRSPNSQQGPEAKARGFGILWAHEISDAEPTPLFSAI